MGNNLRNNQTSLAYTVQGVFFMCRKKQLQGWCLVCFGFGLMLGQCLDSWLWCSMGGLFLVIFGFYRMGQR